MRISGWGRHPWQEAEVLAPRSPKELSQLIVAGAASIGRGLGRSYGDSALGSRVIDSRYLDRFLAFDRDAGVLRCEAGVSLAEILRVLGPKGWFLPVVPGTSFVTVAGAIASDVHGKSHHVAGSFCDHVDSIELLLGSGERVHASARENTDLFRATCGGIGLTGLILSATLRLQRLSSTRIVERTIRAPDLDATIAAFSETSGSTYSMAWIDCIARGRSLGRSLVTVGEHAEDGRLDLSKAKPLPVPIEAPSMLLNRWSMRAFNAVYFRKVLGRERTRTVRLERHFFPLDVLANWNLLYGPRGFVQYQCVIPRTAGLEPIRAMLERIANSSVGSFLGVLKAFGRGNENLLSFPIEGYTLAVDFQTSPAALALLDDLDRMVVDHGGRIYLTKDARMSAATFRACYPKWEAFQDVRAKYHALGRFRSAQSLRLGLE